MVKKNGKNGKSQYHDACFLVTKEFCEKLYNVAIYYYQQGKEKLWIRTWSRHLRRVWQWQKADSRIDAYLFVKAED